MDEFKLESQNINIYTVNLILLIINLIFTIVLIIILIGFYNNKNQSFIFYSIICIFLFFIIVYIFLFVVNDSQENFTINKYIEHNKEYIDTKIDSLLKIDFTELNNLVNNIEDKYKKLPIIDDDFITRNLIPINEQLKNFLKNFKKDYSLNKNDLQNVEQEKINSYEYFIQFKNMYNNLQKFPIDLHKKLNNYNNNYYHLYRYDLQHYEPTWYIKKIYLDKTYFTLENLLFSLKNIDIDTPFNIYNFHNIFRKINCLSLKEIFIKCSSDLYKYIYINQNIYYLITDDNNDINKVYIFDNKNYITIREYVYENNNFILNNIYHSNNEIDQDDFTVINNNKELVIYFKKLNLLTKTNNNNSLVISSNENKYTNICANNEIVDLNQNRISDYFYTSIDNDLKLIPNFPQQ